MEINGDLLRNGGQIIEQETYELIWKIWEQQKMPEGRNGSIILPISIRQEAE